MTLADPPNLPRSIFAVLDAGRATLRELAEYYSLEDVACMVEVISIANHNAYLVNREQERRNANR